MGAGVALVPLDGAGVALVVLDGDDAGLFVAPPQADNINTKQSNNERYTGSFVFNHSHLSIIFCYYN